MNKNTVLGWAALAMVVIALVLFALAQLGVANVAGLERRHVQRQPFFRSGEASGKTGQQG